MAARILGNTTTASVASVKLRAGVASVVPMVGLTYTYPVSDIAYILLASYAYLDTTGRFKYITEIVSLTDSLALSTAKFVDTDYAFATDDTFIFGFLPAYSDSVSLADTIVPVLVFIRDVTDTATITDSPEKLFSQPYFEIVTPSDSSSLSVTKIFADSFALNDLSDAAGPTMSFSDFTNNAVSATDASVFSSDKTLTDTFSASDSGTVTSQNYCDITYFLTDYVGESRTF
jgi:hypothetical protein